MNTLHLYDLDFTLWRIPSKLAVIDKNDPTNIVYRIPPDEIAFMKSYYQTENLAVEYNGGKWYLSKKLWDEISKNLPKNSDISDIGISDREWTNEEILEEQLSKTEYLLENLDHLKNEKVDIGFLTARSEKDKHEDNIKHLKERVFRKLKQPVKKVYFVNDIDNNHNSDHTAMRKCKVLLEHLVGYKIKNNKFTTLKQSTYEKVNFYDDEPKNIECSKNLQFMLENMLVNTSSEIKNKIIERIKHNDLYYITNEITSNNLQPFLRDEKKLLLPNNVKLFEDYE